MHTVSRYKIVDVRKMRKETLNVEISLLLFRLIMLKSETTQKTKSSESTIK